MATFTTPILLQIKNRTPDVRTASCAITIRKSRTFNFLYVPVCLAHVLCVSLIRFNVASNSLVSNVCHKSYSVTGDVCVCVCVCVCVWVKPICREIVKKCLVFRYRRSVIARTPTWRSRRLVSIADLRSPIDDIGK